MGFQKATKRKQKLKAALTGTTSSGKTYSALLLARALVGPEGRIGLIDSERGSAALYSDLTPFDHLELTEHSIDSYKKAIAEAKAGKYDALIIDSMSHEWMGKGGALEEVDRARDKFTEGWRNVTPKHTGFLDDVLAFPGHVVATLRKKMEYVIEKNDKGKNEPRRVGLAPVQREGVEYEFSVVLNLEDTGLMSVVKTRCSALNEKATTLRREQIGEVGALLKAWLEEGADPLPSLDPLEKELKILPALFETTPSEAELDALWGRVKAFAGTPHQEPLTKLFTARKTAIVLAKRLAATKPSPTPPQGPPSSGATSEQTDIPY